MEQTSDLLYGLAAIARHLNLTVPQVKWQIAKSGWPTFKQGATVCSTRSALAAHFAKLTKEAGNGERN